MDDVTMGSDVDDLMRNNIIAQNIMNAVKNENCTEKESAEKTENMAEDMNASKHKIAVKKNNSINTKGFPCPYCRIIFSHRCGLNRHLREIQCFKTEDERQDSNITTCTICLKEIRNRSFKRHLKNLHNIDSPASRYHTSKSDDNAKLRSLLKSSNCDMCGQAVKLESLKQHMENVHNIINEPQQGVQARVRRASRQRNVPEEYMPDNMLQLLPTSDYQYSMITYNDEELASNSFTSSFTVNVHNQVEFTDWRNSFQAKSRTQYTIIATASCSGVYILFKQYLKCVHHKRQSEAKQTKGTACPARLTVTIRFQRTGKRKILEKFPCRIDLSWHHNHPIIDDQILRHHLVSPATKEKLVDLYNHGHSPSSALLIIQADIEDSIGDEQLLHIALADRAIFPDVFYCHYIFDKVFKRKYGNPRNTSRLVEYINELNNEHGENTVMQEEYDGKNLIAICTPLMKRIHEKVGEAGELMFVDSSVRFNWKRYRIFLFTTHSKAGVIPLAVGITPSDSIEALTRLFNLIKQVLPENAFYLRGRDQGPQLVMTDDSSAEQIATQNVWPQTQPFLSQFHVLQSTWRYLLLEENGIAATDRPALFGLVKNIMYAQTHQDLCAQYELFLNSPALINYRNFEDHIRRLYESKGRMWCSAFRTGLSVIDIYTSNSVEYQFRILKDQIFKKTNAFNIVQMTHFITDRLSSYYEHRLLDYSSNRLQHQPLKLALEERIDTLSEDVFEILSNDNPAELYTVNIATCMCTCKDGSTGKLCKHVHYIQAQAELCTNSSCSNDLIEDLKVMYFIACGCEPAADWLEKLSNSIEQSIAIEKTEPLDCISDVDHASYNNDAVQTDDDETDDALENNDVETDDALENDDVIGMADTSDSSVNVSSVTNDIRNELMATEHELMEVFHSTVNRHAERNPIELLAACRAAIDTLKGIGTVEATVGMLYMLGKIESV